VKDIRRATRRHFSAEDKIRIVLDDLRGEDSIAELSPASTPSALDAERMHLRRTQESKSWVKGLQYRSTPAPYCRQVVVERDKNTPEEMLRE